MKRRWALIRRVLMGLGVLSLVLLCASFLLETPDRYDRQAQPSSGRRIEAMLCAPFSESGHNDAPDLRKSDAGEKLQSITLESGQRLINIKALTTDANGNWVISCSYIRELSSLFPPGDLPI